MALVSLRRRECGQEYLPVGPWTRDWKDGPEVTAVREGWHSEQPEWPQSDAEKARSSWWHENERIDQTAGAPAGTHLKKIVMRNAVAWEASDGLKMGDD